MRSLINISATNQTLVILDKPFGEYPLNHALCHKPKKAHTQRHKNPKRPCSACFGFFGDVPHNKNQKQNKRRQQQIQTQLDNQGFRNSNNHHKPHTNNVDYIIGNPQNLCKKLTTYTQKNVTIKGYTLKFITHFAEQKTHKTTFTTHHQKGKLCQIHTTKDPSTVVMKPTPNWGWQVCYGC